MASIYSWILISIALVLTFSSMLMDNFICNESPCYEDGVPSLRRTTVLNVTRTNDDFPDTLSLRFLRWFWFTLLFPFCFIGSACFCCCYYRFVDARDNILNEPTELVLMTDYKSSAGFGDMSISASIMNHRDGGKEQKKRAEKEISLLDRTQLENSLSQMLTLIEENLGSIDMSLEELMSTGEVEIEAIPGQRSFNRKPGLAHWEFINTLERIGVRINQRDALNLCTFLDPNNTGRISFKTLKKALENNAAMLHRRTDLRKLCPPVLSDLRHVMLDEALIRLHRGIGLRDISSARKLLDSRNRGFFTCQEFETVVKEHSILLSAREVVRLEAAIKENSTDNHLSTALFGVVLASSIQRREKAMLLDLLRHKKSAHAIIVPALGAARNINDAMEGMVSFNMLVDAFKCLSEHDEAAALIGASLADETCGETSEHGALTSTSVRADVLMFASVDAWRDVVVEKGFRFLSQASAFGHLPGAQAAKVLLAGQDEDELDNIEKALVTHLLGGAGVVSHGIALDGWRCYLSGLITGLVLCDASGEARRGKATHAALSSYLITLQGLILHAIFDRLSTYLAMAGRTVYEVFMDSSTKNTQGKASISHETLRNILTTFAIPLHQEEVITLIAKYDKDNSGLLMVDDLVQDSRKFAAADEVWSSLSDALGAGGGAQLLLPALASFCASSSAKLYNSEETRQEAAELASTGARVPLIVMKSALIRCCGLTVEPEDWVNITPELDPLGTGVITVECFMMLISAHRARRISRAWSQIIPQWKHKSLNEVLSPFTASKGDLTYEDFLKGLNCTISSVSTELLRSILLILDPYETGKVKLSLLEIVVRDLFKSSNENNQDHSQQNDVTLGSGDKLAELSNALKAYNSRWRRELTEMSAQPKRTEAEKLYFSDVTELISINSTTLSCLSEVRQEAFTSSLNEDGFHLARAKKARALLSSKQLEMTLLLLLELQRDLTNLYLLARGFRLHGSAFPASEEKKRLKLLSRLRRYRDDMLLLVKVIGEDASDMIVASTSDDTLKTNAITATSVWRSRASDRLWAEFKSQLDVALYSDGGYSLLQKQLQSIGSGEVTYWEFFGVLRKLGAKMDETESDIMVQALDVTGSGKINVELILKHFEGVIRSEKPPTMRALSTITAQLSDTVDNVVASTSKFMEDVLGSKLTLKQTAEEKNKMAMMQRFVGDDPELALASGLSLFPPPLQITHNPNTSKLLDVGTPVLALHKETGDHLRATVLKDHGDGFVAVQYTLAILGKCERLSKNEVVSLNRKYELECIWHEVSKAVGEDGLVEVVVVVSDMAGKISHNGLLAWLQCRGMGELDKRDKHILLVDLDPLCKGMIDVGSFKSKLSKFRKRNQTKGIPMHQTVAVRPRHDSEEKDEFTSGVKDINDVKHVKHLEEDDKDVPHDALDESDDMRIQQLEAMMLDMAERERELTVALIQSQAQAEELSEQVDHKGRVTR